MPSSSPEIIIHETKRLVASKRGSDIKLNANGGNSILLVCEPVIELEYVQAIKKFMDPESYEIIDLNDILNDFIEANKSELENRFNLLKGSIQQVFKTPEGEEGPDLFGLILQAISKSFENKKIPVIIHSGALYGSQIENIHIMENPLILNGPLPLIILYPATKDGDKLMFLGKRPASKYRCIIID
jgi:hypothetical protein